MDLAENWSLRYANYRAYRMMRGATTPANPTNRATLGLFNDSTGPSVLVVRDFEIAAASARVWNLSYQQLDLNGTLATVTHVIPSEAKLAGKLSYSDTATTYAPDWAVSLAISANANWPHDLPFAVIPPGWSLIVQAGANATASPILGMLWEVIDAEDLRQAF